MKSPCLKFLEGEMKGPEYLKELLKEHPRVDNDFLECENSCLKNLQIINQKSKRCLTKKGKEIDENQQIFNLWLEIRTWIFFFKNSHKLELVIEDKNKTPDLSSQDETLLVEVKHCGSPNEDKYIKLNVWYDVLAFNKNGLQNKIDCFAKDALEKFNSFNRDFQKGFLFLYYTPAVSLITKCRLKGVDWKINFLPQIIQKDKLKILLLNTFSLKNDLTLDLF